MSEPNPPSPEGLRDTEARVARLAEEVAAMAATRRDAVTDPGTGDADTARPADDARSAERQAEVAAGEQAVAGALEENAAALRATATALRETEARLERSAGDVQSVVADAQRLRDEVERIREAVRRTPAPLADDATGQDAGGAASDDRR
jgi:hypothetical protein